MLTTLMQLIKMHENPVVIKLSSDMQLHGSFILKYMICLRCRYQTFYSFKKLDRGFIFRQNNGM